MAHQGGTPHLTVYQFGSGSRGAALRAQRQLAELRRREERTLWHEASLWATRAQGCRSEFEQITDKRSLCGRAKYQVATTLKNEEFHLDQRKNKLRALLHEEAVQWNREAEDKAREIKAKELEELRRASAAVRSMSESERRILVQEKRIQQYRERCEEARVMASVRGRREASDAQRQQVVEKLEAERSRAASEFAWAEKQRQRNIQAEETEREASNCRRLEQQREAAIVLRTQLEDKREAERNLRAARHAEELKTAEQACEQKRKEKEQEVARRREQHARVAGELRAQITERKIAAERARDAEAEEARRLRTKANEIAKLEDENARLAVLAARREEREARESTEAARRARDEHSVSLERLVEAERRHLEALGEGDMQQRDQAKRRLAQEVAAARRDQYAARERSALAEREAREAEARDVKERAEKARLLDIEEKRADAQARQQYRNDLQNQMALTQQNREREKREDERRRQEAIAAEEQFRRSATELLTATVKGVPHPFAAPPPPPAFLHS